MCQSRSTIFHGILICVIFRPTDMQEYFLCSALYQNGDNSIVFENFKASIVDIMGELHKNRNNSTVFKELSVSIVDLSDYCFSGRNLKSAYISSFICVFQLVCTCWENFIRIGITVQYLKSCRCQVWISWSQVSVLLAQLLVDSKTAYCDYQINN